MNNYKITIQYDGTRYKGWQGQNSTGLTIQGKIEAVLGQMAGHAVEVIGSGRTDAGVHAKGQVANFHIEEHFTEGKIMSYLNHYLPDDIAVIAVERAFSQPLRRKEKDLPLSHPYGRDLGCFRAEI
jgi:tRNA pseudouridine38-40 synthase